MQSNLTAAARVGKADISRRMFFLTESGPDRACSVRHVYAPVEKLEVKFGDESSNSLISDIVRTDSGRYRAYGSSRSPDEKIQGIRVWESDDGLNWQPVKLGQVGDTNVIRFEGIPGDQSSVGGPQVLRLRDGRWRMYFWKKREGHLRYVIAESEAGLAWRVPDFDRPALFHPHDGGLWKLAEGLTREKMIEQDLPPEEVMARKRLWSNDASNVRFNEQLDRFEIYSVWLHPALPDRRVDVDNAPGVHRLIQRRFSSDGINFSDPELILMPDERDPWDLQFYFLAPQWFEDFMIGSLGYYRVEDGQQTMDTDLCFSRDGHRWERPVRGGWIPRPEPGRRADPGSGQLDVAGIYQTTPWLDMGDYWLAHYHATANPHNSRVFNAGTMAVKFPKNRFIGIQAGSVTGGFLSEPFFPPTDTIVLDADIKGWLKAELCDAFGRKLPGFHLNDSIPLTGDSDGPVFRELSSRNILRWKSASIADHLHECLRLRFEFRNAVVYSVAF